MDPDPGPSFYYSLFSHTDLMLLADLLPSAIGGVSVLILLLIASALISGSEVAFFSLTNADYLALRDDNTPQAKRILQLKQRPYRLLATILICNNFINIAIVLLSEYLIRNLFPEEGFASKAAWIIDKFSVLNEGLGAWLTTYDLATAMRFGVTVIGVTFLLVLFGEVTPKVYARSENVRLARFMSAPLWFLLGLFTPLSSTLVKSGRYLEDRLRSHQGAQAISREELDEAIDLTVNDEKELAGERDILKRLVTFGDVTVRQIMQSRGDIIALNVTASFSEVLSIIRESSYSRIPVYDEDLDKILGILYAKDLIRYVGEQDDFNWAEHVRDGLLYAPESKKIAELLREFQAERLHMAIIVDEFGGTSGLVTLEDILEEVIGDIKDEFDDDLEIEFEKIDERNYRFEGKTQLTDALRIMGLPTNELDELRGEADTLAGVMLEHLGRLPQPKISVVVGNLTLLAETVSKRRIERIRITLPPGVVKSI
ncbi:MAG: gliding motility-associated protein GldE [Saprospiraceae bacterium]